MLARSLQVVLLAVALVSLAVALLLGRLLNLGPVGMTLVALVVFFAVPAGMILATFAITWRHRTEPPPELRIGRLAAVRCVLHEIFSYTTAYVFLQPFPRLAVPIGLWGSGVHRPVVVLVHGYMCNDGVWAWLARYLIARRHTVETVTLEPLFARIEDYVTPLARRVSRIVGENGRVVLIGHSMGGLVCRAYARRVHGARIARVITLGTPHHGSALAPLGYGANALDMRPECEWLRGLAASEQGGLAAPITSIYSVDDNFVAPQDSSVLAGAKNVPVAGIGHLGLLFSRRVARLVEAELSAFSVRDSQPEVSPVSSEKS